MKNIKFVPKYVQIILSSDKILEKYKQKQNKENHTKTKLDEKYLAFHDALYSFVFLYFSTARQAAFALHDKRW